MADDNLAVVSESSPTESELARRRLRQRWELASVLNFLHVFEPVIEINMKVSAEEIETAIITPNSLLAQLHIALLKGIPPVSKTLSGPDAWVTVLCKKLAMWWPWQDDTVSYVNDALKDGTAVAAFRKDTIGGDGNGTKYWYDGNAVTGYRLYKEVSKFESKPKVKSNGNIPTVIFEWETLATNLEEFRKVVNEFSSSKGKLEVALGNTIETDAIPILEKLCKKKERALKQQQRQEMLLNGFHSSGITRSCRNRRPVNYTFDDYDRTIKEAIQLTKRRKTIAEEQMQDEKHSDHEKTDKNASSGCSDRETELRNSSVDTHDSVVSDTESDEIHGGNDDNDDDYNSEKDNGATLSEKQMQTGRFAHKRFGSRWSTRLAGSSNHSVSETKSPSAKNRSRQRPTRNSALETAVVPDSEDGLSSDNANN
ncbi:hypothetical protein Acr_20g0002400 [Actinidia rufa]|uniref:DDT domain-containing protein n=1 Tax=Actinidia rufa TaxID=165716 RepID=A0A7J0GCF7_9ERIC|nr:hypothetical protein Acr_20g0002400 [Actinidia rufa]